MGYEVVPFPIKVGKGNMSDVHGSLEEAAAALQDILH